MTNFDFFANCKTAEDARKRYFQLSKAYHPDLDNGDNEIMTAINDQYAAYMGRQQAAADLPQLPPHVLVLPAHLDDNNSASAEAEEFMQVVSVLLTLPGVNAELCGCWVWVSGDTKAVKDRLAAIGCKYASKKQMWYWAPASSRGKRRRGSADMASIRAKYGSRAIKRSADED